MPLPGGFQTFAAQKRKRKTAVYGTHARVEVGLDARKRKYTPPAAPLGAAQTEMRPQNAYIIARPRKKDKFFFGGK